MGKRPGIQLDALVQANVNLPHQCMPTEHQRPCKTAYIATHPRSLLSTLVHLHSVVAAACNGTTPTGGSALPTESSLHSQCTSVLVAMGPDVQLAVAEGITCS